METGINQPLKGQLSRYHASQPPGGARQVLAQPDELGRVENISDGAAWRLNVRKDPPEGDSTLQKGPKMRRRGVKMASVGP